MFFLSRTIFIVLLTTQLYSMQPAQQSTPIISAYISHKYDEEKGKFQKYKLDQPEKFIAILRKQLKKEQDPIAYLKNLRLFASKLLVQAILVQKNSDDNYCSLRVDQLIKDIDQTLEDMGAKKVEERKFQIIPENDEQLAEILAHSKVLQEEELYTPEQLQAIYSWIIDPSKGKFLHLFGKNRKLIHEGLLTKKIQSQTEKKFDTFATPILDANFEFIENDPKIIQNFSEYIARIFENYQEFGTKLTRYKERSKKEFVPRLIREDYDQKNKEISDLYAATDEWYRKLYELIYQELKNTLLELIKKDPSQTSLKINLSPLPETAVKAKTIPAIFPNELPKFIPPSQTITLPSLESELAQARAEWEKSQKEKAKKEVNPIEEKAVETPSQKIPKATQKIKKSIIDDSYILEGEETPTQVIIHNPKNKTTEIIFKTDNPNQIKNFPAPDYTEWVNMWFTNPQEALQKQGYTELGSKKYYQPKDRWQPITRHAFSRLIDDFIKIWGTRSEIDSRKTPKQRDILITIPGKIIYKEDGKEYSQTGVYTYIIDSVNKQWYHRLFTPEDSRQLIEDYKTNGYFSPQMTGYYDVFFPPLPGK